jgi:pyridoxine 4-dehydrogenase
MTSPSTFLLGGDLPARRLGYGAMRLCGQPGNFGPYPDWSAGELLLRRAVELGVNFIDTAEAYGPGWNEQLIAAALAPYPSGVVVATKGGVTKKSLEKIFPDGRPENLRRACECSLKRLKLDRIDLYQWHRPDPAVPLSESVGELARLRSEGKIRHVGLSNVSIEQIEAARAIVPIVSVQNRMNLAEQESAAVLDYCLARSIAFLPYGPLGAHPLKHGAPLAEATGAVQSVALRHHKTVAQVALAWMLQRAANVIVIPGTTTLPHLEENVAAAALALDAEDIAALSAST